VIGSVLSSWRGKVSGKAKVIRKGGGSESFQSNDERVELQR